jgi:hypothetical protein
MRTKIVLALLFGLMLSPVQAQVSKSTLNTNTSTSFPDNTSGAITPAGMRSYFSTLIASFQQFAGVRSVVVTTDAITTSDYGQLIIYNNASPIAVSIAAAGGSFSTFNTFVSNAGAGAVTITPSGGSTINGASTLVLQTGQGAWIVSDGTNYQIQSHGFNAVNLTAGTNISISSGANPTIAVTAPIAPTSYTAHAILLGEGTANISPTTVLSGGQLLVGQAGADPLAKTLSQDCTLTNAGAITCTKTNNVAFGPYSTATQGQLPGTTTNDAASTGNIGEYLNSNVASGSAISLSNATPANLTSKSLTAGDWDVWCDANFAGVPTGGTTIQTSVSTTSATVDSTLGRRVNTPLMPTASSDAYTYVNGVFSLASTTTIFCVVNAVFSGGSISAYGNLQARRRR